MSRLRSGTAVELFVSLPSEITTIAFLRFRPAVGQRDGFGQRVVHRGAAARNDAAHRSTQSGTIGRPVLEQERIAAELIEEHLILRAQQFQEKAVERAARVVPFFSGHAAAGVDDQAQADRHTLVAEVRDLLLDAVLVERQSRPAAGQRCSGR